MTVSMKAFVIMPFADEVANSLYNLCTKKICEEFNLICERADEIITPNPIIEDIVKAIEDASIIIADISGKNANVFYELGMSHMLKQNQTIIITKDDYKHTPFDIQHFRIIRYENTISGKEKYEKELRTMLKNILRDYKTIYKNEFDMMIRFRIIENRVPELLLLLALKKSPKPITRNQQFHFEGHYETSNYGSSHISAENEFIPWITYDYVKISGNYIVLTDKGKAFVEILENKGFVVDLVNEHKLTQGYVMLSERAAKKKKQKQKS